MQNTKPAALSWFTQSTFKFTPQIIELTIIAIAVRLIGLVQPFVFQALIDRVLPFQRVESLTLILFILIGATAFSATLGAISTYLGAHMANRLTAELGWRIYDHVLRLPLGYLQRWQVGETLARVREIDTVRQFLTGTVLGIALDILFALIYLAALLSISPFLTMIVMIMLPLQMVAFGIIGPFLRARMQVAFQAGSLLQAQLVEAFGSVVMLKALASEPVHRDRISTKLNDSLDASFHVTKLKIPNDVIGEVLRNSSVILVIYFGTQLVFASEITLGQLIAFHLLAERVAGPIVGLSQVWEHWQGLRIARLRLGDFLNEPAETDIPRPILPSRSLPTLKADRIHFAYREGYPVFEDFSHEFSGGMPTLIVGDSGCGKSTLGKVLAGLYAPSDGRVVFAGHDLAEFDPASVRRRIAYVAQEPTLFSGTILENLLMAKADATEDEVRAALELSASTGFTNLLGDGLHTQVGERGAQLSGGQRQRIALARSILTDPDILILDEPTSSLDEESAAIVMETVARLTRTKTVIVITHRPELVKGPVATIDLNKIARMQPCDV